MANNFATPEQIEEMNDKLLDKMRAVVEMTDEEFAQALNYMFAGLFEGEDA